MNKYRLLLIGACCGSAYATSVQAAQCEYVVQNEWNSGFVAEIRITNDGVTPIDGWQVNWSYDNAISTNQWNANVTGSNPYMATNLTWNSTINPGQTVVFGLQGNKSVPNTPAPIAVLTGSTCSENSDPDDDNDGVLNGDDQCPNTPAGDAVDAVGCSIVLDDDNDGVENNIDQCPNTPAGDVVDAVGCSIVLDDDNDGVENNIDQCPNTPAGDAVDALGCSIVLGDDDDNDGVPNNVDQCPDTPVGTTVGADGCAISNTSGTFRVDASGNITKNDTIMPVRCGNWFGLEGQHEPLDAETNPGGAPMELFSGNMWWVNGSQGTGRTVQQTMSEIKAQGITMIRLPIAPQTLDENDPQGLEGVLKNHPSIRQTNARQAMTDFIKLADENDLQVLIDIHSCSNYVGWRSGRLDAEPPYTDADRIGYEYTREDYSCGSSAPGVTSHEYNQTIWLDNLREIAGLSAELGVDNIIGIDIFNEPWDYTWLEWKSLAESAFTAINEVNTDMLIFVEGVGSLKSDGTEVAHGNEESNPNWGENLYGMRTDPLAIPKDRLVLSPHAYGPSVFVQNAFLDETDPNCVGLEGDAAGLANCNIVIEPTKLREGWDEHFGFLRAQGFAMVVGEFGGNFDWPHLGARQAERDLWSHITTDVDLDWQNAFVDYLIEEDIQACYWSINPESADTGGWYGHEYDPVSNTSGWGTWTGLDTRKTDLLNLLWGN